MEKISFKQQIQEARNVRLSKHEKASIRAVLLAHMRGVDTAPSPVEHARAKWREVLASFSSRTTSARPAFAMAAVFLFALVGIASAAEGALPGSPLYSIKVNINEKVLSIIAADAQAETELQGKLATRRLKEAEELALKGELDTEHQVVIEKRFKEHTEKAKIEIARIKEEDGAEAAANASSQVEASLDVHQRILTSIGTQAGPEVQSVLFPLVGTVQSETGTITEERVGAESEAALAANADTAKEKEVLTQKKLTEARKAFRENLLTGEIFTEVEELLQKADDVLWQGREKLDDREYSAAVVLFQESYRLSQQALELANTDKELNITLPSTTDVGTSTESSTATGEDPADIPGTEANVGGELENVIQ